MRGKGRYIIILLLIIAAGIHWDMVRIARTKDRNPVSEMIVATYDVDKIRVGGEVETLVIVQANTEQVNTTGILFAYTRTPGKDGTMSSWQDQLIGIPVLLGRSGLTEVPAGDGRTPKGMYELDTPFGNGVPREGFPETYVQTADGMPEHAYCLNIACPTADGDAAVLLQCYGSGDGGTDGSVSTDEDAMQQILCLYKEGKTIILIDEKGYFSQYY